MTTVLDNLRQKGTDFYAYQLRDWYDCGNKDALISANKNTLYKRGNSQMEASAIVVGSCITSPYTYIADGVTIENSIIEGSCSIERGAHIANSHLVDCIIGENAKVFKANLVESVIGANAFVRGKFSTLNISDFSEVEI